MHKQTDIIIALATPSGRSALAVIRASGKNCKKVVEKALDKPLKENGRVCTRIFKSGGFVEKLNCVWYKSGYTGEESVELYVHGNPLIIEKIITTYIKLGMKSAEGGEFSYRAYQNGKLDLSQCEAILDIIEARSESQLRFANMRAEKKERDELDRVKEDITYMLAFTEAQLHYQDEMEKSEIAGFEETFNERIERAINSLEKMIYSNGGRIEREGLKIALLGEPNVGKSTLLNALIGKDRAIVDSDAGTTRDTIEEGYVYKGRAFVITDTAGIRGSDNRAEQIGVERALKVAEDADVIVAFLPLVKGAEAFKEKTVIIENKCDDIEDGNCEDGALKISAKFGKNIDALKEVLLKRAERVEPSAICNPRQKAAAAEAVNYLKDAVRAKEIELKAQDLYDALDALKDVNGEKFRESVIGEVFKNFCVGK